MMKTPRRTTHLAPQRSVIQPVSGASIPPSNRPILLATEVAARLKCSSCEMGLKRTEMP